ncbi:MAG: ATP-binding protein [Methylococcales bacterium]
MTSLHNKITLSYSLFSALIFLLSIIAYSDLLYLETKIKEGSEVNSLKHDITELRRHEKNILLYNDLIALDQIKRHVKAAINNINLHQNLYESLVSELILTNLLVNLENYQALFSSSSSKFTQSRMQNIRVLGHGLSDSIDKFAAKERQFLASMAKRSQWALAGAIFLMAIFAIAIGWKMSRSIGASFNRLEKSLIHITKGNFDYIEPVTNDKEFITLSKAINHMLHELELRHHRLLQSEKLASLGVLVSGVAHELNNPLANISSSCQLLIEEKNEAPAPQIDEWLQQIDNETERARNIVKALLEYGRKKEFKLEYCSLNDIIDKTLFLLKNHIRSTALINLDIPDNIRIHADIQCMQQVFINLIRNSLDSCHKNINISITAATCNQSTNPWPVNTQIIGNPDKSYETENYCEIYIKDDGPGIPSNILNKIFDPFFTTKEPGKGMGLGLYIVQEIIQDHKGSIGVISDKDNGTKFILRLPCKDNL